MILIVIYLSNNRLDLLDTVVNKNYLLLQKIQTRNLTNFIVNSAKELSHATHLVIDLSNLQDNNDEMISTLNRIKKVYMETRIIVLADSKEIKDENTDLLRRIFEKEVYDILTDGSECELENVILKGKTREDMLQFFVERPNLSTEESRKELDLSLKEQQRIIESQTQLEQQTKEESEKKRVTLLPNKDFRKYKSQISVAIAGTEKHIGTTHNALMVTRFLNQVGFKCCYLECSEERKIFYLKAMYPEKNTFNERKQLLQYHGVDLYSDFHISDVMAKNYDFYIFDLGILTEDKLTSFLTKDIKILVCGTKAWEMKAFSEKTHLVSSKNEILYFLNELIYGEEHKIKSMMGELAKMCSFIAHSPNPFTDDQNIEVYKKVFKEYILEQSEQTIPVVKKSIFSQVKTIARRI